MGVFIIAEAGVNHNGDINIAKKLVEVAANSGADAIKFQSFRAELLVTKSAQMAQYQQENTNTQSSQYEMLKKLELSESDHFAIQAHCQSHNIQFLSTPFDPISADLLIKKCGLPIIKIGSGDLTNLPLLYEIAQSGVNLILSTGMAILSDIDDALKICYNGYKHYPPTENSVIDWHFLGKKIAILHCITDYPAPAQLCNLRAINTLQAKYPHCQIGYSDHALGIDIAFAAIAMGAQILEKHITLDKNMHGPDHIASTEPQEFKQLVAKIRAFELAKGDGIKRPNQREIANQKIACKSLVALKNIAKGEIFNHENLGVKRPSDGIKPKYFWQYLGTPANQDYRTDELIQP